MKSEKITEKESKTHLMPLADVVTPNLPEAVVLLNHEIRNVDDMRNAARDLAQFGSGSILIKGRKDLDDELNRRAWRDTLPRFALRPGALDRARYLGFADFLMQQGMIKSVPPLGTWAAELPAR